VLAVDLVTDGEHLDGLVAVERDLRVLRDAVHPGILLPPPTDQSGRAGRAEASSDREVLIDQELHVGRDRRDGDDAAHETRCRRRPGDDRLIDRHPVVRARADRDRPFEVRNTVPDHDGRDAGGVEGLLQV
jgi:hypothetical protein